MFILRTIDASKGTPRSDENQILGDCYSFHRKGGEGFDKYIKSFGDDVLLNAFDDYVGVIESGNDDQIPIYRDLTYFVMTESGKTFARINQ